MKNKLISLGSICMAIGIILGALGAHALKEKYHLPTEQLESYKTGVLYQLIHSIGIIITGILAFKFPQKKLVLVGILFFIGIIFFSGSIYLLSTRSITNLNVSFLGPITPLGGLIFICGWILLAIKFIKNDK